MCGLVAAIGRDEDRIRDFVSEGSLIQAHRGPDAAGVAAFEVGSCHIALGHQRLSILDLSEAGQQPMTSSSGRFVIVYNGEAYNYLEIRDAHGLHSLRSASDTEVVLELCERLGPEMAFRELNGMWALVLLDRLEGKLYLSRDRFGKKPLHWMMRTGCLYIASEVKTLVRHIGSGFKVDPLMASRYLTQSLQDIDERTWFEGVISFPAASFAVVDLRDESSLEVRPQRYWDFSRSAPDLPLEDYIRALRHVVEYAIRIRLRSDVPVGVALSGGLDSSIIAAVVARECAAIGTPVRLFSAVSPGRKEDEGHFIDMMGAHMGARVEKVELDPVFEKDFDLLMDRVTFHNDAPIASFSNVLFYLLMEKAADLGIKVVYSGQGADEGFCGYRKYPMLEIKRLLCSGKWLEAISFARPFLANGTVFSQFSLAEAKRYLGSANRSILGEATRAAQVLEPLGAYSEMTARQIQDFEKYSVPYLTHYEDRLSMAWSREIRAPFLDYRVVEMGVSAPVSFKLRDGWTKYCLRKAFEDVLPPGIAWRKDKQGFVNPQDDWLRGKLLAQVEAMIADRNSPVFEEGLVDRDGYRELFARYLQGRGGVWFRDAFAPFALNRWLQVYRQFA